MSQRHLWIGPSAEGLWVVRDAQGVCGAVFHGREDALRFARDEGRWTFVPALDLAALFAPPQDAASAEAPPETPAASP